jgi:hypothetical protein
MPAHRTFTGYGDDLCAGMAWRGERLYQGNLCRQAKRVGETAATLVASMSSEEVIKSPGEKPG